MALNFIANLKNWVLENYKVLILCFIIACVTFPSYSLTYVPGIDGPLPWVFNYLANGHYILGQTILFPHGPLAFLLYPLPMGNNLVICSALTFMLSFLFSFALFKIYFIKKEQNYLLPTILLLLLQSLVDIQLLIIGLTLTHLLLFESSGKKRHLLFALLFCVLNLYIKTYGGVICILLIAYQCGRTVLIKKDIKLGIQIVSVFFAFFYLVWFSLYKTLNGSLMFLLGQYHLLADNSEAVSFYQVNNWWFIGISLGTLILIPFASKDKNVRSLFMLMLLPFFAAWKHAMSRADDAHMLGFLNFLILFSFLAWLVGNEKKISVVLLSIISISAFSLNMASTAIYNDFSKQKDFAPFKPFNLYNVVVNYDSIVAEKNRFSKNANAIEKLPDSILKIIGKSTVDVLPWNYSIISVNNLNWVPRPALHSYASYTTWLDEQNAKHLRSKNSAHFVIWELDELGGKFTGIDHRYLLNDAPRSIIDFYCNYRLRFKDANYLLYEKLSKEIEYGTKKLSTPLKVKYDTWINVPASEINSVTRAKLKMRKSFLGTLKSFFYKGESFSAEYETSDKKKTTYKMIPKNAEDGIWLNPFIIEPQNNAIEPTLTKIKITCWDKRMYKDDFEIEFEQIKFNTPGNFLEDYFNKTDSLHK
jgi:hypothetical protein